MARRWSELSRLQQTALVLASATELALTATALRDLARRPPHLVRGPKAPWLVLAFVQPVGPPAYLLLGRRPS